MAIKRRPVKALKTKARPAKGRRRAKARVEARRRPAAARGAAKASRSRKAPRPLPAPEADAPRGIPGGATASPTPASVSGSEARTVPAEERADRSPRAPRELGVDEWETEGGRPVK